ncbi:MAG: DUF1232 domain-containing protein [Firmicutes bacterium]|nr:DUF1232 domain-containing protein [Bacillota bacterium]
MNHIGLRVLLKRLHAIKFMMKDKKVPLWKKALIVLGIVYIVVPTDLIPFVVFPFAGFDDILIAGGIIYLLADTLDTYWYGEKPVDLSKKFSGKNIVEGVEYEVDNKGKDDEDDE